MKTGLTKRQKTTCIYFDEASKTVEIQTHNTALKKRLARYAAKHTDLCRQTDDDEQGGLTFEIDRRRFAVRLTAPYSDERRHAASELAKGNTNRLSNAKQALTIWGKIRYITFPHHIEFKREVCYNGEKSGIVLVPDGGKQNGKAGSHPRR